MQRDSSNVLELTKRYGMSLVEAAAVPVPCGNGVGSPMGEQCRRSLYWFATRKTSTTTKPGMMKAICAARIIRADNQSQAHGEILESNLVASPIELTSAKKAITECLGCGKRAMVSRCAFDRKSRPRCFSCGGTLTEINGSVVDDFITAIEATEEYGISAYTLRKAAKDGAVLKRRERGRDLFGRSSVERFLVTKSESCH